METVYLFIFRNSFVFYHISIYTGVVNKLKDFLSTDETMWLLTNLFSDTTENTSVIIDAGLVPLIIKLLNSNNINIQSQSMWCLGNIAGDSVPFRDLLLERGILDNILLYVRIINIIQMIQKIKK